MADLIPLSDTVWAVPGAVNSALARTPDGGALLIDSGGDKSAGRALRRACEALGLEPRAIVNTHAHADHFGGNDYLVRNLGLPVYAPPLEASLMQAPYLEPVYLAGGARPIVELTSKWLQAPASPVDRLLEPGETEIAGVPLELIDTSGHAHVHYSVRIGRVLLAADALFGTALLARYPLPFGQDAAAQRASAALLAELDVAVTLPGHGDPSYDLPALVAANLVAFDRAAEAVEAACAATPGPEERVARTALDALGVEGSDLPRHYLNLCTVRAHLTALREAGRVRLELDGNGVRWSA